MRRDYSFAWGPGFIVWREQEKLLCFLRFAILVDISKRIGSLGHVHKRNSTGMAKKSVSQKFHDLVEHMLRLGTLVEQALQQALTVLQTRDEALAKRMLADDSEIDRLRNGVEEQAIQD